MPKPRVFLSSTYYDMRYLRGTLELFIREMGYEPVLFERGRVGYAAEEKLEHSCLREIELCDIVVNLIGGRFGAESTTSPYSITQSELRTAIDAKKQVYIFVERPVLSEFRTWQKNKQAEGIVWAAVEDVRIYNFIEEVYALPHTNLIQGFETSSDIVDFLKEQWASLLHRYVQAEAKRAEAIGIREIQSTAQTLRQLVNFLQQENQDKQLAFERILTFNHPIFNAIKESLKINYRVAFANRFELDEWLRAHGFIQYQAEIWDSSSDIEWIQVRDDKLLVIDRSVFNEDGSLKVITPDQWNEALVRVHMLSQQSDDSDVPF